MKLRRRIAALGVAAMMMTSMSIGASAYTTSDSNNRLYYSGNETTTNYYVTYSKGTNKSGSKKFHIVSSIIYSKSSMLASNTPSGITASGSSRECYAKVGASNVYRSYHRSILRKSTSYSDGDLSRLQKYIYY